MKILLIEDDANIASFIIRGLKEAGYEVSLAPDGNTGLEMIVDNQFDLSIMDIMLPGISGIELCKQVRGKGLQIPIIMLTALGTTENIVKGLDTGADDYLVKPFKFAELLARIRNQMKRSTGGKQANTQDILSFGGLQLDLNQKMARRNERDISLTATEFKLLEYFLKNPKRVLSRADILEQVWGIDFHIGTNVVDVYVNYLRRKVDKDKDIRLIHTVIGMGYILKEE